LATAVGRCDKTNSGRNVELGNRKRAGECRTFHSERRTRRPREGCVRRPRLADAVEEVPPRRSLGPREKGGRGVERWEGRRRGRRELHGGGGGEEEGRPQAKAAEGRGGRGKDRSPVSDLRGVT